MKRLTTMVLVGVVLGLMFAASVSAKTLLSVHFIDVGQGDAILIDYGEYELLIDGGRGIDCSLYLFTFVDGPLECIVATHMDADHIGGLDEVFDDFVVDELWINGNSAPTTPYEDFRNAYLKEGCAVQIARRNDSIQLGDIELMVLHPQSLISDRNSNSVVLLLSFKERDFLFTGDIGMDVEDELQDLDLLPDIDVLKVAHHGSEKSTGSQFLEATRPEICVVSTSGQYGHPHEEALKRISCTIGDGWRWLFNTDQEPV